MKKAHLPIQFLFTLLAFLMAATWGSAQTVVVNFSGMNPHMGQKIEARLVDKSTRKEVDRTMIASATPTFSLTLNGEMGGSYYVDFYADFNGNGVYDAPPTDHAWRMDADNLAAGMNMLAFAHNTNFTDIKWKQNLTFDFTGMTPHVGQKLEIRVRDRNRTGKEVGRVSIDAIAAAAFSVDLPFLEIGHSYAVDFYADFNGNGVYDAPPADHAWREVIDVVDGDETLAFSHNTNFTDIKWKQLLTMDFTGMTPHVGQKLEIRVRDRKRVGKEVGRFSMGAIMLADFSVELPFLDLGGNYAVDFYADFNGNGVYDAPPTDHAWREIVADVAGDETLTFSHNTNFTDIKWKQLLTMDFTGMTPHVGQKLEIRVRDRKRVGKEVGRFSMGAIMLADFSVELPFLDLGGNYAVDFYADFNGNGVYDAPPTDHAWREIVADVAGDETLTFSHNTNFTDIKWKQLLTMDFTGMTPHVGQKLEIRVRDRKRVGKEVGRFSMGAIMLADFSVELPFLDLGGNYAVDFYADFNGNGVYDAPPTDHAWREIVADVAGDETLTFSHNTNFTDIKWKQLLTFDFTGMTPHLGQKLEIRVRDRKRVGKEVGRFSMGAIMLADFSVELPFLDLGGNYAVDFYADFNGNGVYDAPPTDHAWREIVADVAGDETLTFSHNTNFTDIKWKQMLTMDFTGMTPHVGQKLEIRVREKNRTGKEVGRFSMASIMLPDFSVDLPYLELGKSYMVDFYADFNGNGVYDAPPTDHAWREMVNDVAGDESLSFGHNTNFTDVKWKHLLTFDFTGMTPHVGQQLEIRVRDVNQVGREVGRFTMPAIMLADFTVELPYLDLGRTYFVDFFADFNGNGTYDAPPADHAWRETVAEAAGDESLAFGHNTNFTDIGSSHMLTVDFTGMNPHLGQLLELRVTEAASGKEVERYRGMIGVTEFKVELPGIQNGVEYNVDFYADFNGNGLYDAPPMDHAWRETFTAGSGNETIAFAHNTNFTDVEWVYEMTLAATGMNPHLGQLFELRVVDTGTNAEVGKFSMPSVMVPFFFVRVPGLLVGENYNVDFYADFNGNGTYDAPPTDHAWRVNLDDDEGDELVEFGHNTDFVDIMFTTDVKDIAGLQNLQVFPNPFSGAINMNLDMEAATDLSISLYNSVGQQVKTLWQGAVSAGTNTLSFEDLGALDKGVYFLKMQSGDGGTVTTVMIK